MPVPAAALAEFVSYVGKHLTGDEKGEPSDFLDGFFRVLVHDGIKEAGARRQIRPEVMAKVDRSQRDLHRSLEEPGSNPLRDAQAKLDAAVRAASAMPKNVDILAFLLAPNQICAAKEAAGESITQPGLPLPVGEHAEFLTEDCIEV